MYSLIILLISYLQAEYYKQAKDILDGDDTLMECDGVNGSTETTPVVTSKGDHVCACVHVCVRVCEAAAPQWAEHWISDREVPTMFSCCCYLLEQGILLTLFQFLGMGLAPCRRAARASWMTVH